MVEEATNLVTKLTTTTTDMVTSQRDGGADAEGEEKWWSLDEKFK